MTTTRNQTYQRALDAANPNELADILRLMKFGHMCCVVKAVVTSLTANATPDITSAGVLAAAVVTGIDLNTGEALPPIGQVVALRVTASGTATSLGAYGVTDAGGTAIVPPGGASAALGIALLSDDGTTITFPNTVTAFVIEYIPRASVVMTATYDRMG